MTKSYCRVVDACKHCLWDGLAGVAPSGLPLPADDQENQINRWCRGGGRRFAAHAALVRTSVDWLTPANAKSCLGLASLWAGVEISAVKGERLRNDNKNRSFMTLDVFICC